MWLIPRPPIPTSTRSFSKTTACACSSTVTSLGRAPRPTHRVMPGTRVNERDRVHWGESPSKSDAVTSAVREEVAASDDARPGGHE